MGQTASNVAKKVVTPITSLYSQNNNGSTEICKRTVKHPVIPYVFKRRGSMYFDEDGDLAHEFYEEVFLDRMGKKRMMRKQERNLIAQGEIELPFPRLHVDFPIVICEAPDL
ncbi:tumor suppressor candidate 2 [Octopus bimaculoides]|uniref:Tumor suppressor candidate 2 n=1 Tax=Octopus bimaculoides TaxID=37653 RepID=A0A0L8G4W8_OCTBM|nr:tumor suppressor candidate 2 [Octopus bimaculoides]|eukprot:XP_014784169.1 PREDICTED: tumor suppressor candidate 2-like [Octopus bimaculoides]